MTQNVSLLTHSNCIDGSACAILFVVAGFDRKKVNFSFPEHVCVEDRLDDLLQKTDDIACMIGNEFVCHEGYVITNQFGTFKVF